MLCLIGSTPIAPVDDNPSKAVRGTFPGYGKEGLVGVIIHRDHPGPEEWPHFDEGKIFLIDRIILSLLSSPDGGKLKYRC